MESSDAKLLSQYARQRDAASFKTLVDRYSGLVFGTARRVTGDAALAEDVSQEAFLELARHAAAIHGSLGAWLHRVAYRRAIDATRRGSARLRYETQAGQMRVGAVASDTGWDELGPIIDRAIDQLPEDLRLPLVQHFLMGKTQEQLSQEIGVCATTISRRIQRAIKKVRAELHRSGVSLGTGAVASLLSAYAAEAAPMSVVGSLCKIGIAGIGASQAGISAVGGAKLVAALALVLGLLTATTPLVIGLWQARVAAPPAPPAINVVVHPRLGPVVGHIDREPVHAGDLLLPTGWPERIISPLQQERTAIALLSAAAREHTLRRLAVADARAALTPERWSQLQQQRAAVRERLVGEHGQGAADAADASLLRTTGRNLDETIDLQLDQVVLRDHVRAQVEAIAISDAQAQVELEKTGAADWTPELRQHVLAQLRGAHFNANHAQRREQMLARAGYTPFHEMAEATWRWLHPDGSPDSAAATIAAAAQRPGIEAFLLLMTPEVAASALASASRAGPDDVVATGRDAVVPIWLDADHAEQLLQLAQGDAQGFHMGTGFVVSAPVMVQLQWAAHAGRPAAALQIVAEGRDPVSVSFSAEVRSRGDDRLFSIRAVLANQPLIVDMGLFLSALPQEDFTPGPRRALLVLRRSSGS